MSAPRTKRQFAGAASDPSQRQITSFFSPSTSPLPSSSSEPAQQPLLPASVQTNLLSVGMRIRKSVPEGYKTGTPYSGFKLWSDADPLTASRKQPAAAATAARRELLPFCAIHDIGGLSSQPSRAEDTPSLFADDDAVPGLDDVPGLTSSQETVDNSPPSSQVGGRKRFFDDAEDGDLAPRRWSDRSAWTDGEVSPRSLTPVGWGNARVIAVPRKLGRRKAPIGAGGVTVAEPGFDQENATMSDFEEAEFLVGEGMDLSEV